ncbi:diguanylate cyclase (plasmid) [Methylobacterium brachiatum]|nr:diguanylate cyclase [Methylobacterium brachiatum]
MRIAGKVHETVATLAVPSAGVEAGAVTVSVGVAVEDGSEEMGDLYRRADAALYEAKDAGRNQTCVAISADLDTACSRVAA